MDFELDSEHEMIRQTVRDFAEKEVRPVAAHVDKTGEFPKATVAKMAGLGFLGVAIPTEYEGAGLDALALAIGIEEIARVCGSHALIMAAHNSLCTGTIWLAGTDAQKRKSTRRNPSKAITPYAASALKKNTTKNLTIHISIAKSNS